MDTPRKCDRIGSCVKRGVSFLVVNKSRMEMTRSIKARKRKGGAPQAVTVQCKSLIADVMDDNLHSPGTARLGLPRCVVNKRLDPFTPNAKTTRAWKTE